MMLRSKNEILFGTSPKIGPKVSAIGLECPLKKTETESIRVSRELLHTLRDRSRGEGMVWGGGIDIVAE